MDTEITVRRGGEGEMETGEKIRKAPVRRWRQSWEFFFPGSSHPDERSVLAKVTI